jgi:hypothetical protein
MDDDPRPTRRKQRLSILLTEGSSISARQALYALGPQHTIDIIDPSPLCQCRFSRLVRRWRRCPSFGTDPCGYLTFLGRLLKQQKYDVLFPCHDEVFLLSRVREALASRVAIAVPDFAAVNQLHSKIKFQALLNELKLPHPDTHIASSWAEIAGWNDFPRFLKLDSGTAGQGVQLVRNRDEALATLKAFEARRRWTEGSPLILQRPASGVQSVVRAVFRQGRLVGIHMSELRLRGVGGAPTVRDSCHHPPVVDHIRRLGERLAWHGPLFVEYFFDPATSTPAYIEADPRIGDSANATFSGAHVCQQCVDVARDVDVSTLPTTANCVRSHEGFLVLMSQALNDATRRQLLAEMWRQWRHRGIYKNSQEEMTRLRDDWLSLVPFAWVAARLLARPAASAKIVQRTVDNYALSPLAADRISQMPLQQLTACLDQ